MKRLGSSLLTFGLFATFAGVNATPAEAAGIICDVPDLTQAHVQSFACGPGLITLSAWSNTDPFTDAATPENLRFNAAGVGVDGGGSAQVNNSSGDPFYAEWIALSSSGYQLNGIGIAAINSSEEFLIFASDTPDPFTAGTIFNVFGGALSGGGASVDWYNFSPTGLPYILVGTTTGEAIPTGFRIGAVMVPEPATLTLFGTGLLAAAWRYRRRTK